MLRRIGIFADVSNLYYCIGKKWEGRKLDYEKYLEIAQGEGIRIRAIAYGTQIGDEAMNFIVALKHFGYETKYRQPKILRDEVRKTDWDVGIAMDVVRMFSRFDTVVLGTADPDMVPLVQFIQERGVIVRIIACGISRELKDIADSFYEVTEDMLVELENEKNRNTSEVTETTESS